MKKTKINIKGRIMKMNFGKALENLKKGKKVTRLGWNGDGMFIYYVPQGNYSPTTKVGAELVDGNNCVPYTDYIAFKTVDNVVVPWVASQMDLLSNDWVVVE